MSDAHPSEDLVSRLKDESYCTSSDVWAVRLEAAECLEAAAPLLRAHAKSCEACEGSGEKIVGHAPDDYWSEPCAHCKPIWDLIERIEPKPVPSKPRELCGKEVHPGSPCLNDKGHDGECDDIPY